MADSLPTVRATIAEVISACDDGRSTDWWADQVAQRILAKLSDPAVMDELTADWRAQLERELQDQRRKYISIAEETERENVELRAENERLRAHLAQTQIDHNKQRGQMIDHAIATNPDQVIGKLVEAGALHQCGWWDKRDPNPNLNSPYALDDNPENHADDVADPFLAPIYRRRQRTERNEDQ